jgi:hypothetical protein
MAERLKEVTKWKTAEEEMGVTGTSNLGLMMS